MAAAAMVDVAPISLMGVDLPTYYFRMWQEGLSSGYKWVVLPVAYYLLYTTHELLVTSYSLLVITYYLLGACCLLPTTYYLLPTTYYLLHATYYLLHTTTYLLSTAYCLLLPPTICYELPTKFGPGERFR